MKTRSFAAWLACVCLPFAAQAATPTHLYLLNGDLNDSLGGPALASLGGTVGATAYSFGPNQGLSLQGAVNASVYTIDLSFSMDSLGGYQRLIDFLNLSSDTGLYALGTSLNFYNVVSSTGPVFASQQVARLTVTRDAAGTFTGYVDGVAQISFADTSNLAVFSGPAQIAYFFRDDNAVSGEAGSGFVDYIRIYGDALTSTEVASLTYPTAVPEPSAVVLMLAGLALVGRVARRR